MTNPQTQSKSPTTQFSRRAQYPAWLCRDVKQVVVLVRDRSGSMSGQKADDASQASLGLVAELASPANGDGFLVAVVDFSSDSHVVHGLERATVLDGKVCSLAASGIGAGTNITSGLEDVLGILETLSRTGAHGETYLRPVTLLFSDGCHNEGTDPACAASRLKTLADVVTVAFGSDADEALLGSLASTPQHAYRCSNGRELRRFLAEVGTTMTATFRARTNATHALTQIRR